MCTAKAMLDRWKSFSVIGATAAVMVEEKQGVLSINKAELYEQGKDSEGRQLLPYADAKRTNGYAEYKHSLNPLPGYGIPDLKLTGSFQEKMDLSVSGDTYEISSTDSKTASLVKKYGKIFGLTTEGKAQAWTNVLRVPFVHKLAEHTGTIAG